MQRIDHSGRTADITAISALLDDLVDAWLRADPGDQVLLAAQRVLAGIITM